MRKISVFMDLRGLWFMWLLVFLPILCGCVLATYTFLDARDNVRVWRGVFQLAIDTQCPQEEIDIVGGEGKVYLDAYRYDYQWIGDGVECTSNGKTTQCSCRFASVEP